MKFPRRPNLSLFPGHSGYTIRYPRAFLSSTSLLPLLSTPFHPNLSLASPPLLIPLFPSSIHLSLAFSARRPRSFLGLLDAPRRSSSSSFWHAEDTARSNAPSQTGRKRKISVSSDDDRADDSFSRSVETTFRLVYSAAWFRPIDRSEWTKRGYETRDLTSTGHQLSNTLIEFR